MELKIKIGPGRRPGSTPPPDPQMLYSKYVNAPVFEIGHGCYHVVLPGRVHASVTCFRHVVSHTDVHQNCSFSSCSFIQTFKRRDKSQVRNFLQAGMPYQPSVMDFSPSLFVIQQSWQFGIKGVHTDSKKASKKLPKVGINRWWIHDFPGGPTLEGIAPTREILDPILITFQNKNAFQ